jgi:hypothetical protein
MRPVVGQPLRWKFVTTEGVCDRVLGPLEPMENREEAKQFCSPEQHVHQQAQNLVVSTLIVDSAEASEIVCLGYNNVP